jgi:hypothetical protein
MSENNPNPSHDDTSNTDPNRSTRGEHEPPNSGADDDVPPGDDGRFDAEYVRRLREEAKDHRVAREQAETARDTATAKATALHNRVLALEVREHARGILADPDDLTRYVETGTLLDDDGEPVREKIKAAAEALAQERTHLRAKRSTVDVGQGSREQGSPPFDLSALLRDAAG